MTEVFSVAPRLLDPDPPLLYWDTRDLHHQKLSLVPGIRQICRHNQKPIWLGLYLFPSIKIQTFSCLNVTDFSLPSPSIMETWLLIFSLELIPSELAGDRCWTEYWGFRPEREREQSREVTAPESRPGHVSYSEKAEGCQKCVRRVSEGCQGYKKEN